MTVTTTISRHQILLTRYKFQREIPREYLKRKIRQTFGWVGFQKLKNYKFSEDVRLIAILGKNVQTTLCAHIIEQ